MTIWCWERIALALEAELARGELKAGTKLPSEAVLADRFAVNRHTVRRAIRAMAERGLLRSERGRGTFVSEPQIQYPVRQGQRFAATMMEMGWIPERQVLSGRPVRAGKQGAALCLRPGDWLMRVESLDNVDGRPIARNVHYFPLPRFVDIDRVFRQTCSISASLEAFGVQSYQRRQVCVGADKADHTDVDLMAVSRSDPVLVVTNVLVDETNTPIHFVVGRWPARRRQVVINYDLD